MTLLSAVWYSESARFATTASKCRCEYEKDAINQYREKMQGNHIEFSVIPSGFVVLTLKLMFGALLSK